MYSDKTRKMEYQRAWHKAHPEKAREYSRERYQKRPEYYEANRDKRAEQNKEWHQANRAKVTERKRKERAADPEKIRAQARARYAANREKYKEAVRQWRAANPEKVVEQQRSRNFRLPRRKRDRDTRDYIETLHADPCCYCGSPTEAIDHIVPPPAGADDWTNMTAACRSCNSSKAAKPLLLWMSHL